jgi:hypothetical protein
MLEAVAEQALAAWPAGGRSTRSGKSAKKRG